MTRRTVENLLAASVLIFFVAIAMYGAVVSGLDMPRSPTISLIK